MQKEDSAPSVSLPVAPVAFRPTHPFTEQVLSACCALRQASSSKSFAIEEGKTSSTLIVKVFHLADLWGEISMDLEVVLISGKIQDLMTCGKKFYSSRKLAKETEREYKVREMVYHYPFPSRRIFQITSIYVGLTLCVVFW